MKSLVKVAAAALIALPVLASAEVTKFSTSQLKALDCTELKIEKKNAERQLKEAQAVVDTAAASQNSPTGQVSKWAGMASSALSAFGGNSEKASKANDIANNLSANSTAVSAEQLEASKKDAANAQANAENISEYQAAKKCKL